MDPMGNKNHCDFPRNQTDTRARWIAVTQDYDEIFLDLEFLDILGEVKHTDKK